jgi:hypothetical protein
MDFCGTVKPVSIGFSKRVYCIGILIFLDIYLFVIGESCRQEIDDCSIYHFRYFLCIHLS